MMFVCFKAEITTFSQFPTAEELEYDQILEFFEPYNALFAEENRSVVGFDVAAASDDMQYFDTSQMFQVFESENRMKNSPVDMLSEADYLASYEGQNHTTSSEPSIQADMLAGKRRKKFNSVLKYLESLPAFPASAADLSPKPMPSKGSSYSGAAAEGDASQNVNKKLVKSLSVDAAQRQMGNGSSVLYFVLACFVLVCSILWLFIASSGWKLVERV
jgi:hypothetical protein